MTEAFSQIPSSSETTSEANPLSSQEELDQKDLEACRRMFDSVEQALIEMGLSKPMSTESKPAEGTDRPKKQKTD